MEQHELGQLVFRCRMHLHYPLPAPHCSTERLLYEKRGTVCLGRHNNQRVRTSFNAKYMWRGSSNLQLFIIR